MKELNYPVNALVSYHYFKRDTLSDLAAGGLRLIGDSGAFSAVTTGAAIQLEEFADWAIQWRDSLSWIASLDVIGDPDGTLKNYETLRGMGIDVVPTLHYGGEPELLDFYAADGVDFLGLGGMVGQGAGPQLTRWLVSVFRYARDKHPEMRFHGWGLTRSDLLMSLPWYSTDSSSYGSAWRYGQIRLFDPRHGKWLGFSTNGRDAHKYRHFLEDFYGVTPDEVSTIGPDNMPLITKLQALAYQRCENFLRRRFDVKPPKYGLTDSYDGPHVHVVDGAKRHLRMLAESRT